MTTDYVLGYHVPQKMKDEGVSEYVVSFRDLTLKKLQTIEIKAAGQYYYFVGGFSSEIRITSETGIYDLIDDKVNEMQHEHTTKLTIVNRSNGILHLQFVVVALKNK